MKKLMSVKRVTALALVLAVLGGQFSDASAVPCCGQKRQRQERQERPAGCCTKKQRNQKVKVVVRQEEGRDRKKSCCSFWNCNNSCNCEPRRRPNGGQWCGCCAKTERAPAVRTVRAKSSCCGSICKKN